MLAEGQEQPRHQPGQRRLQIAAGEPERGGKTGQPGSDSLTPELLSPVDRFDRDQHAADGGDQVAAAQEAEVRDAHRASVGLARGGRDLRK